MDGLLGEAAQGLGGLGVDDPTAGDATNPPNVFRASRFEKAATP